MKSVITEALQHLNPSDCTYLEWISIGMALKAEGFSVSDWEDWSRQDPRRYHPGECARKWDGFRGSGITGGTIVALARQHGYHYFSDPSLAWDAVIGTKQQMKANQPQDPLMEPDDNWNPAEQLSTFIKTLFHPDDIVGYVTKVTDYTLPDGSKNIKPTVGTYHKTAQEILDALRQHPDNIKQAIGNVHPEAGAWFRLNPLDGKYVRKENVTDFRYALVESDRGSIWDQYEAIKRLKLPVATLVHSGNKSLHAVVKVDASTEEEYAERVTFLFETCQKHGFGIDTQNKNANRMTRMPGVLRNGRKQFLIATNIGCADWDEWINYISGLTELLPAMQSLSDLLFSPPPLADELIEGVLRKGHKAILAGPSKAGKSFSLIELAISITEGLPWMNFQCHQGKVLYINLEIDEASCVSRFSAVYDAMGITPQHSDDLTVWNLRGKAVPLASLIPYMIKTLGDESYAAVILDPIYKVMGGTEENSATAVTEFCNKLDKICTELDCSVLYVHHFSKGDQGQKKSIDRASGSGVYGRDADAVITINELDFTPEIRHKLIRSKRSQAAARLLDGYIPDWRSQIDIDSDTDEFNAEDFAEYLFSAEGMDELHEDLWRVCNEAEQVVIENMPSPFRLEFDLREFKCPDPLNIWFDFPLHTIDEDGILGDAIIPGAINKRSSTKAAAIQSQKDQKAENINDLTSAFIKVQTDGEASLDNLSAELGISAEALRKRITRYIEQGHLPGYTYERRILRFEQSDGQTI